MFDGLCVFVCVCWVEIEVDEFHVVHEESLFIDPKLCEDTRTRYVNVKYTRVFLRRYSTYNDIHD